MSAKHTGLATCLPSAHSFALPVSLDKRKWGRKFRLELAGLISDVHLAQLLIEREALKALATIPRDVEFDKVRNHSNRKS